MLNILLDLSKQGPVSGLILSNNMVNNNRVEVVALSYQRCNQGFGV
jgi:hypothetical protein